MTDPELMEQFQLILQAVENVRTDTQTAIAESETRTKVFVENQVCKRIDSLFGGYKLAHEKQWELERQSEQMPRQLDDLQARLTALESRTA